MIHPYLTHQIIFVSTGLQGRINRIPITATCLCPVSNPSQKSGRAELHRILAFHITDSTSNADRAGESMSEPAHLSGPAPFRLKWFRRRTTFREHPTHIFWLVGSRKFGDLRTWYRLVIQRRPNVVGRRRNPSRQNQRVLNPSPSSA